MSIATPIFQLDQLEQIQLAAQKIALYNVEVIEGVAREKPLPKRLHQIIQDRIRDLLRPALPREMVLLQLDVLCNGDLRVPDIVVFAPEARFERDILVDAPLLCVEIMSPGQTLGNLFVKCEAYHRAGVPECWVVWPRSKQAWRYFADGKLIGPVAELTFGAAHIRCADLFANLPSDAV